MRVRKLESCREEERIGCRWEYALAETAQETLAVARALSRLSLAWGP
ncbi:hypothetical protein [Tropicimonas sp. IMCC34011]|nr:hypothetical protein [Tropicimonas sp. IMCC34011]